MITLKPHQRAFVERNPDKAILAWGTRVGKQYTIAFWAKGRKNTRFILACPKRIVDFWIRDLKLCGVTNVTVVSKENLKKTNLDEYNGFIFDECFVAGTRLWGGKKIEDVREGDLVRSVFEYGWVTKVHKTKSDTVVRINGDIECTPGHPFLTPRGWTNAIDLQVDEYMLHFAHDSILRSVWEADQKRGKEISQSLLGALSREKDGIQYPHEGEEPNAEVGRKTKDEKYTRSYRSSSQGSWWKWSGASNTAAHFMRSAWHRLVHGACRENELEEIQGFTIADPFQDRYSQSISHDRYRSGWKFPWASFSPATGQEKGQVSNITRVDSIEVLERPGTEFFNISVSGHPSYVLESGIVVHNCHHLASGLYDKPSMLTRCVYEWLRLHPDYPVLLASATPIASKPSNLHTLATLTGKHWDWKKYREHMYDFVRRPYAPFPFWEPKPEWRSLIKPLAKEVCDIVLLSDVMDVPEQKHEVVKVELTEKTKKAIKDFAAMNASDEWYGRHRLAQGEEKLEKIRELSEGESKVIIVCKYTDQVNFYAKELAKDREVFVLDGHTKDQGKAIKDAHESTECFMICQADALEGFRGDTFSTMIFASMSWRTVALEQAYGRMLHLDKQSGNQYYYLIADERDKDIYNRVAVAGKEFSIAAIAEAPQED